MPENKIVAIAVRVEYNQNSDDTYLVFKIIDEEFKNKIKRDWTADVDLKLLGHNLIINKE